MKNRLTRRRLILAGTGCAALYVKSEYAKSKEHDGLGAELPVSESAIHVKGYDDARKLTGLSLGQTVSIKSRSLSENHGEGLFIVEVSEGRRDDDGIILRAGKFAIVRQFSGSVLAVWFGVSKENADNTRAIQNSLSEGRKTVFPSEELRHSSQICIPNLSTIDFNGATLIPSHDISDAGWLGRNIYGARLSHGTFQGSQSGGANGRCHLLFFEGSADCIVEQCQFLNSRADGLHLERCARMDIRLCQATGSFAMGLHDRDGRENTWTKITSSRNGYPLLGNRPRGRGLLIWRGSNISVRFGVFEENTEYGFRVYSSSSDVAGSNNINVSCCFARDNGYADYYVYDESRMVKAVGFVHCSSARTNAAKLASVVLQGTDVTWNGGSIWSMDGLNQGSAISLYAVRGIVIADVVIEKFSCAFVFSPSSYINEVLIKNCVVRTLTIANVFGGQVKFDGNSFMAVESGSEKRGIVVTKRADVSVANSLFIGFDSCIEVERPRVATAPSRDQPPVRKSLIKLNESQLWELCNYN